MSAPLALPRVELKAPPAVVEFKGLFAVRLLLGVDGRKRVVPTEIADSLGIDPDSFRKRVHRRFEKGCTMMNLPPKGGQAIMTSPLAGGFQDFLTLDLRYVPALLLGIDVKRVRREIRFRLGEIQEELDLVLAAYTFEGVAINPAFARPVVDEVRLAALIDERARGIASEQLAPLRQELAQLRGEVGTLKASLTQHHVREERTAMREAMALRDGVIDDLAALTKQTLSLASEVLQTVARAPAAAHSSASPAAPVDHASPSPVNHPAYHQNPVDMRPQSNKSYRAALRAARASERKAAADRRARRVSTACKLEGYPREVAEAALSSPLHELKMETLFDLLARCDETGRVRGTCEEIGCHYHHLRDLAGAGWLRIVELKDRDAEGIFQIVVPEQSAPGTGQAGPAS